MKVGKDKREKVFAILRENEPLKREIIVEKLQYNSDEATEILQDMLYDGYLETTPDWKYERTNESL